MTDILAMSARELAAYYNDNDPFVVEWMTKLVAAGHIAPGRVDGRSITEVSAADVAGPGQRHFFAGIGIWSYALRIAGVPDSISVWTGSCPCQGFSDAGAKRGFADERHLWPVWFSLIQECRPGLIFGEQVASGLGLEWLDLVQRELEGAGYAVWATDLGAAGIGAPHIRQRLYFVAVADGFTVGEWWPDADERGRRDRARWLANNNNNNRREIERQARLHDDGKPGNDASGCGEARWIHPADGGRLRGVIVHPSRLRDPARRMGDARGAGWQGARGGTLPLFDGRAGDGGGRPGSGLGDAGGHRAGEHAGELSGDEAQHDVGATNGDHAPFDPSTACGGFWADCEWLYCKDGRARPVEPGTFPLAHGAAARVGRLRAYGNGIVSEQASTFIRVAIDGIADWQASR